MILEPYKSKNCIELMELFYNTVHIICAADYSPRQLDAWAPKIMDKAHWDKILSEHNTIIAYDDNTVVGFGDMDVNGYLDRLYVHHSFQRRGIASAILKRLECESHSTHFSTYASITAIPFFEAQGYHAVRKNTVIRCDTELDNYMMEKLLLCL